jgi:hypothetical protein
MQKFAEVTRKLRGSYAEVSRNKKTPSVGEENGKLRK